jgi:hypothetical protein
MAALLKRPTVSVRPYSPGVPAFDEGDSVRRPAPDRLKTVLVIAAALASVLVAMVAARSLF